MSDLLKDALRLRGNPYASLQLFANEEADALAAELAASSSFTAAEHARFRDLGNPYAKEGSASSATVTVAAIEAAGAAAVATSPGVTQAMFELECRRIFRQYIPEIERGRLREHHRNFIGRNRSRSPEIRANILIGLKRYDLGEIGVQAMFNRERDELTDEKLLGIENAALNSR